LNPYQDSGNPFGIYNSATAVNRTSGKRSYAANTYYAQNAQRSNFVVLTGAQATKIEFKNTTSGKASIATGVSFAYNSTSFSVKARKEVILSAGPYFDMSMGGRKLIYIVLRYRRFLSDTAAS
jgi:hypothetical protein